MRTKRGIVKDKRGFTGLEAAIVLTAFIVVAAVFSYMVLGAGFFSTEKAKAVVHTGVESATSSAELVGDVIGRNTTTAALGTWTNLTIDKINFTIQLTAGQNPLDLGESIVSFTNKTISNESVVWINHEQHGDNDGLLEPNEKAEIQVDLNGVGTGAPVGIHKYNDFQLEFKPEAGGTLVIERHTGGTISKVTRLY